jgi:hypothetical protein
VLIKLLKEKNQLAIITENGEESLLNANNDSTLD